MFNSISPSPNNPNRTPDLYSKRKLKREILKKEKSLENPEDSLKRTNDTSVIVEDRTIRTSNNIQERNTLKQDFLEKVTILQHQQVVESEQVQKDEAELFTDSYRSGTHIFFNTKHPLDSAKKDHLNLKKEFDYWKVAHAAANHIATDNTTDNNSEVIKEPTIFPILPINQQKEMKIILENSVRSELDSEKWEIFNSMENVRNLAIVADRKGIELTKSCYKLSEEVSERIASLAGAMGRSMTFDARVQARRILAQKKLELEELQKTTQEAVKNADLVKRHVELLGFLPISSDASVTKMKQERSEALFSVLQNRPTVFKLPKNVSEIDIVDHDIVAQVSKYEKEAYRDLMKSMAKLGKDDGREDDDDEEKDESSTPKKKNEVQVAVEAQAEVKKEGKWNVVKAAKSALAHVGRVEQALQSQNKGIPKAKTNSQQSSELSIGNVVMEAMHSRGLGFNELISTGHKFVKVDMQVVADLRLERKSDEEEKEAKLEEERMERQSKILELLTQGEEGQIEAKKIIAIDEEIERIRDLVDKDFQILQKPNINIQTQEVEEFIERVNGKQSVVIMGRNEVPPLCKNWVRLMCRLEGHVCKYRHYFISDSEKRSATRYRLSLDSELEEFVIKAIADREQCLIDIHHASDLANKKYLDHTGLVREKDVHELLSLLNHMRILTVKAIEAVYKWREIIRDQQLLPSSDGTTTDEGLWIAKLAVFGKQLYPGSSAFESKVKRFRRDADNEGLKETNWIYLGAFRDKVEAALAYDQAVQKQAIIHQTTIDRMPKKVFIIRSCKKHFGVESDIGSKDSSRCEQCVVKALDQGASFTPAWMYNGINYILKMPQDLNFLEKCEPLKKFLPGFTFERNPFLLQKTLDNKICSSISNSANNQVIFGEAKEKVTKFNNGVLEWFGHITMSENVRLGIQLAYSKIRNVDMKKVNDVISKNGDGSVMEVLDMDRIDIAVKIVLEEEELQKLKADHKQKLRDSSIQDSLEQLEADLLEKEEIAKLEAEDDEEDPEVVELRKSRAGELDELDPKGALFHEAGASMEVYQSRTAPVFIIDGQFCKDTVGKWKSLRVRGKHSQHFAFERKIREDGIKLQKKRKKLQLQLHRAIRKENPTLVQELIDQAIELKGTLLLMDAKNAEQWLVEYWAKVKSSTLFQRVWRGHKGRMQAALARAQRAIEIKNHLELESTSSALARIVVPNYLTEGIKNAKLSLINPPVYQTIRNLQGDTVVVMINSDRHKDYVKKREPSFWPCYGCGAKRPKARYEPGIHGYKISNGPCQCIPKEIKETICIRAYNPETESLLELRLTEKKLREKIIEAISIGKINPKSRLATAAYLGRLETDSLLKKNIGVYRRDSFEPFKESETAKYRASVQLKLAECWENLAKQADVDANEAERYYFERKTEIKAAQVAFHRAHEDYIRALVTEQAMIKGAADAMAFSKKQLLLMENPDMPNYQQAWDPLENASTHFYLKQKRLAIKDSIYKKILREEARKEYLLIRSDELEAYRDLIKAKEHTKECKKRAIFERLRAVYAEELKNISSQMALETAVLLASMITIRTLQIYPIKKSLCFFDQHWITSQNHLEIIKDVPVAGYERTIWFENCTYFPYSGYVPRPVDFLKDPVLSGWNVILRNVYRIPVTSFLDYFCHKENAIVTVLKDPGTHLYLIKVYIPRTRNLFKISISKEEEHYLLVLDRHTRNLKKLEEPMYNINYVKQKANMKEFETQKVKYLCSLLRFGRWDGRIKCGSLDFFQKRTLLEKRLFTSRWFRDHQKGKTSGKGIEVLSEGRKIDDKYCRVSVFDNWGDLHFEIYIPRLACGLSLSLTAAEIYESLREDPAEAEIYNSCRSSLTYNEEIIRIVCSKLCVIEAEKYGTLRLDTVIENSLPMVPMYCINFDCPLGLQSPQMFSHPSGDGRLLRMCARCNEKLETSMLVSHELVLRKKKVYNYSPVSDEIKFVSGKYLNTLISADTKGNFLVSAYDSENQFSLVLNLPRPKLRYLFYSLEIDLPNLNSLIAKQIMQLIAVRHLHSRQDNRTIKTLEWQSEKKYNLVSVDAFPSLVLSTITREEHWKIIYSQSMQICNIWIYVEVIELPGKQFWLRTRRALEHECCKAKEIKNLFQMAKEDVEAKLSKILVEKHKKYFKEYIQEKKEREKLLLAEALQRARDRQSENASAFRYSKYLKLGTLLAPFLQFVVTNESSSDSNNHEFQKVLASDHSVTKIVSNIPFDSENERRLNCLKKETEIQLITEELQKYIDSVEIREILNESVSSVITLNSFIDQVLSLVEINRDSMNIEELNEEERTEKELLIKNKQMHNNKIFEFQNRISKAKKELEDLNRIETVVLKPKNTNIYISREDEMKIPQTVTDFQRSEIDLVWGHDIIGEAQQLAKLHYVRPNDHFNNCKLILPFLSDFCSPARIQIRKVGRPSMRKKDSSKLIIRKAIVEDVKHDQEIELFREVIKIGGNYMLVVALAIGEGASGPLRFEAYDPFSSENIAVDVNTANLEDLIEMAEKYTTDTKAVSINNQKLNDEDIIQYEELTDPKEALIFRLSQICKINQVSKHSIETCLPVVNEWWGNNQERFFELGRKVVPWLQRRRHDRAPEKEMVYNITRLLNKSVNGEMMYLCLFEVDALLEELLALEFKSGISGDGEEVMQKETKSRSKTESKPERAPRKFGKDRQNAETKAQKDEKLPKDSGNQDVNYNIDTMEEIKINKESNNDNSNDNAINHIEEIVTTTENKNTHQNRERVDSSDIVRNDRRKESRLLSPQNSIRSAKTPSSRQGRGSSLSDSDQASHKPSTKSFNDNEETSPKKTCAKYSIYSSNTKFAWRKKREALDRPPPEIITCRFIPSDFSLPVTDVNTYDRQELNVVEEFIGDRRQVVSCNAHGAVIHSKKAGKLNERASGITSFPIYGDAVWWKKGKLLDADAIIFNDVEESVKKENLQLVNKVRIARELDMASTVLHCMSCDESTCLDYIRCNFIKFILKHRFNTSTFTSNDTDVHCEFCQDKEFCWIKGHCGIIDRVINLHASTCELPLCPVPYCKLSRSSALKTVDIWRLPSSEFEIISNKLKNEISSREEALLAVKQLKDANFALFINNMTIKHQNSSWRNELKRRITLQNRMVPSFRPFSEINKNTYYNKDVLETKGNLKASDRVRVSDNSSEYLHKIGVIISLGNNSDPDGVVDSENATVLFPSGLIVVFKINQIARVLPETKLIISVSELENLRKLKVKNSFSADSNVRVTDLLSRLIFTPGNSSDGSNDQVELDKQIWRSGILINSKYFLLAVYYNHDIRGLRITALDPSNFKEYSIEVDADIISKQTTIPKHLIWIDIQKTCSVLLNKLFLIELNFATRLVFNNAKEIVTKKNRQDIKTLWDAQYYLQYIAPQERNIVDLMNRAKKNRAAIYARAYILMKRSLGKTSSELKKLMTEWNYMSREDEISTRARPYLVAPSNLLLEVQAAFQVFDKDSSGSLDAKEFQQLVFECGETITYEQAIKAVALIDTDKNGTIEFDEFAIWWLCVKHELNDDTAMRIRAEKTRLMLQRSTREFTKVATKQALLTRQNTVVGAGIAATSINKTAVFTAQRVQSITAVAAVAGVNTAMKGINMARRLAERELENRKWNAKQKEIAGRGQLKYAEGFTQGDSPTKRRMIELTGGVNSPIAMFNEWSNKKKKTWLKIEKGEVPEKKDRKSISSSTLKAFTAASKKNKKEEVPIQEGEKKVEGEKKDVEVKIVEEENNEERAKEREGEKIEEGKKKEEAQEKREEEIKEGENEDNKTIIKVHNSLSTKESVKITLDERKKTNRVFNNNDNNDMNNSVQDTTVINNEEFKNDK